MQIIEPDCGLCKPLITFKRVDLNKNNIIDYRKLDVDKKVSKISIVGIGMRSHSGIAKKMFKTLGDENINIKVISTSEIKISVLLERKYLELAIQSLHQAFELSKV